jgi:hypothetical protein
MKSLGVGVALVISGVLLVLVIPWVFLAAQMLWAAYVGYAYAIVPGFVSDPSYDGEFRALSHFGNVVVLVFVPLIAALCALMVFGPAITQHQIELECRKAGRGE